MKKATIQDVAHQAGVNKSTVSHVITGKRFVADETRQRVMEAIAQLNYRPSRVARSLAVQQTFTAGLLISDVGNPFYHRIIRGVEDVALTNDYSVFLFNASYDLDRSIRYIRSMSDRRVDGVILMSSRMSNDLVNEALSLHMSVVVLDWEGGPGENLGVISFDFENGIRQVVTHFIELGHTRFADISGDLDLWTARERRDLFLDILSESGIDPDGVPVVEGDFSIHCGRTALRQLWAQTPRLTAILTVNDMTAIGIIFEAQKMGLRIPEELSVVGVDDIALGQEIDPPLTTLSLHRYEIGCLAMNLLLDLIHKRKPDPSQPWQRLIQPDLVLRGSTEVPYIL